MEKKELFKWLPTYSIKIDAIDEQHKKWLGIMNNLFHAFKNKGDKEEILKVLKEMKKYTIFHFGIEERYFTQFNYVEAGNHKKLHTEFVAKLEKFQMDYENDSRTLTMEMMTFMQNWLINHIVKEDVKYAKLFSSHGL